MKEISKAEAKAPDIVTSELKAGFTWTVQHSKLVMVLCLVFLGVGGAVAGLNFVDDKKETALAEKFYIQEKQYLELKEQFEMGEKKTPANPENKVTPKIATGDLEKDYGPVVQGFSGIVNEAPKSKAAALAAMSLVEVYQKYQKTQESVDVLKKAQGASGVLGYLVKQELGTQLANLNDCKGASDVWSALLSDKKAEFLEASLKLKLGLCAENMGQKDQAKKYYQEITEKFKESASAKTAEKLLRVL